MPFRSTFLHVCARLCLRISSTVAHCPNEALQPLSRPRKPSPSSAAPMLSLVRRAQGGHWPQICHWRGWGWRERCLPDGLFRPRVHPMFFPWMFFPGCFFPEVFSPGLVRPPAAGLCCWLAVPCFPAQKWLRSFACRRRAASPLEVRSRIHGLLVFGRIASLSDIALTTRCNP